MGRNVIVIALCLADVPSGRNVIVIALCLADVTSGRMEINQIMVW